MTGHTGHLLTGIGVVHVAITPRTCGDAWRSIIDGGVIGSIDSDPAVANLRSSGLWYVVSGLALIALGRTVTRIEGREGAVSAETLAAVAGIASLGTVLMPRSGFPALFVPVITGWLGRRQIREFP